MGKVIRPPPDLWQRSRPTAAALAAQSPSLAAIVIRFSDRRPLRLCGFVSMAVARDLVACMRQSTGQAIVGAEGGRVVSVPTDAVVSIAVAGDLELDQIRRRE